MTQAQLRMISQILRVDETRGMPERCKLNS